MVVDIVKVIEHRVEALARITFTQFAETLR
jgi:hypothetical protein